MPYNKPPGPINATSPRWDFPAIALCLIWKTGKIAPVSKQGFLGRFQNARRHHPLLLDKVAGQALIAPRQQESRDNSHATRLFQACEIGENRGLRLEKATSRGGLFILFSTWKKASSFCAIRVYIKSSRPSSLSAFRRRSSS